MSNDKMSKDEIERKMVIIHTDGSCIGNPGPGGYGVVLTYGKHRKELSGGFRLTTNNRMEIMAAIVGLKTLERPCKVKLYSDSRYVIDTITKGWAIRWRKNNWLRNEEEKALNTDLWERLLDLCDKHQVEFVWVKGHAGHRENECCDKLAAVAAKPEVLPDDKGYDAKNAKPRKVNLPDDKGSAQSAKPRTVNLLPDDKSSAQNAKPRIVNLVDDSAQNAKRGKVKITYEGQPCRKCSTPVVKKKPRRKLKQSQTYYYEYYLGCPDCGAMYLVEEAKREIIRTSLAL